MPTRAAGSQPTIVALSPTALPVASDRTDRRLCAHDLARLGRPLGSQNPEFWGLPGNPISYRITAALCGLAFGGSGSRDPGGRLCQQGAGRLRSEARSLCGGPGAASSCRPSHMGPVGPTEPTCNCWGAADLTLVRASPPTTRFATVTADITKRAWISRSLRRALPTHRLREADVSSVKMPAASQKSQFESPAHLRALPGVVDLQFLLP